jgi:glycerol uptake facilitator protein
MGEIAVNAGIKRILGFSHKIGLVYCLFYGAEINHKITAKCPIFHLIVLKQIKVLFLLKNCKSFILINIIDMLHSTFWGEFLGTLTLLYLGNGVVANVLLNKTKGHGQGFMMIALGWALAVTMGVFVATHFGSTAAHINPAVSIAAAVTTGSYTDLPAILLAQLLGAMAGASLVWLQYNPHWEPTPDPALKLACFATGPAIGNTFWNFISEFVASFAFGYIGGSLGSAANGLGPLAPGLLVWAIGVCLGGPTGYAINPARDLGPRIMHALLPIPGKGSSNWPYAWIPVLAPILGVIAGAALAK